MPKQPPSRSAAARANGGPGSARARLRLAAVAVLALLTAYYGGYALLLYFASPLDAVTAAILAAVMLLVALAHGLSARWVARQMRWGHLVALAVTLLSALSGWVGMTWLEVAALVLNAVAFVLLLGCIPRKGS